MSEKKKGEVRKKKDESMERNGKKGKAGQPVLRKSLRWKRARLLLQVVASHVSFDASHPRPSRLTPEVV